MIRIMSNKPTHVFKLLRCRKWNVRTESRAVEEQLAGSVLSQVSVVRH